MQGPFEPLPVMMASTPSLSCPSLTPFSRLWSNGSESRKLSLATAAHVSSTQHFSLRNFKPMLRQKEQRDEQLDSLHLEPLITVRHSGFLSLRTLFSPVWKLQTS